MKSESLSANKRYHKRYKKYDYSTGSKVNWTYEKVKFIYINKGKLPDRIFAKKFKTTIKAIMHIFYKINLANKLDLTRARKIKLVCENHWKTIKERN